MPALLTPNEETPMAESPPYPGTPRWVKIAGIVTLVLILAVIGAHLTGIAPRGHTPPMEHGAQRP